MAYGVYLIIILMYILLKLEIYIYQKNVEKILLQHFLEVSNVVNNVHNYCLDIEKWTTDISLIITNMNNAYKKLEEIDKDEENEE